MLPSKVIGKYDIADYTTTTIKSRSSSCFGIFLNLTNGKKILVSDLTFANYMPVELFLEDLKITKSGEEDFSFFSYYRHQ